MPKEAFLKLNRKKRDRLLDSAREVFSRGDIEELSTSDIVSAMKISRASFYLYFNDKEDLFLYCMESFGLLLYEKLHEAASEKKTIFDCALSLFDFYAEPQLGLKDFQFVGNIFCNMNAKMSRQLMSHFLDTPKFKELKELYYKNYKEKNVSMMSFGCLVDLLFQSLISSIAFVQQTGDKQTAKEMLLHKINILKNGIQ